MKRRLVCKTCKKSTFKREDGKEAPMYLLGEGVSAFNMPREIECYSCGEVRREAELTKKQKVPVESS